jgi:hypothetical protein
MQSANLKSLENAINELFVKIDKRIDEICSLPGNNCDKAESICDYVTNTLAAESKSLLSTLYSKMSDATLSEPLFSDVSNANKFYSLDLRSLIYEKYIFSVEDKIDYKLANERLIALSSATGTIALGAVLTTALSSPIVIPIAIVVAGALYFLMTDTIKKQNKEAFSKSVRAYVDSLKEQFIIWLENIEKYYNEKVEELKKTL